MLAVRPGAAPGAVEWCLRGGLWPWAGPRRGFVVFGAGWEAASLWGGTRPRSHKEGVKVGVVDVLRRPRRWPNVTADLDTRAGELYAPMGEVLPFRRRGGDGAVGEDRDASRQRSEPAAAAGFASSREQ